MMMWDVSGVIAMDKKNCHELWQFFLLDVNIVRT